MATIEFNYGPVNSSFTHTFHLNTLLIKCPGLYHKIQISNTYNIPFHHPVTNPRIFQNYCIPYLTNNDITVPIDEEIAIQLFIMVNEIGMDALADALLVHLAKSLERVMTCASFRLRVLDIRSFLLLLRQSSHEFLKQQQSLAQVQQQHLLALLYWLRDSSAVECKEMKLRIGSEMGYKWMIPFTQQGAASFQQALPDIASSLNRTFTATEIMLVLIKAGISRKCSKCNLMVHPWDMAKPCIAQHLGNYINVWSCCKQPRCAIGCNTEHLFT